LTVYYVFLQFSLYNIDSTNRYVDSLLKYNYYQGQEINDYLTERINNELLGLIEEKIEKDELSSLISFNQTAARSEFFVNVFTAFSIPFLVLIGLLVWASNKNRSNAQEILKEMDEIKKEAIEVSDRVKDAEKDMKNISFSAVEAEEEIKKIRLAARKNLITQIMYKDETERLNEVSKK